MKIVIRDGLIEQKILEEAKNSIPSHLEHLPCQEVFSHWKQPGLSQNPNNLTSDLFHKV